LNKGYSVGTYCLSVNEKFHPVGEPEDYFKYYNLSSQFFHTDISNYKMVNEYDFFKIEYGKKGEFISGDGSLLIPFCYPYEVISDKYIFNESSYYLLVYDVKLSQRYNINNYTRGWIIGDFEPCIKRTCDYEIGILSHKKDEKWGFHYHDETREINILLSGIMVINNISIKKDTIFIFEKGMISCPIFLTDCIVLCIKVPSRPNDKIII